MYVCICQAITDRQIERAVDSGIDSVDALRDTLGVASCCGSCEVTAETIVADRLAPRPSPSFTDPPRSLSERVVGMVPRAPRPACACATQTRIIPL